MGIGMLGLIAVEAAVRGGADSELAPFDIALEFSGSEFGVTTCIDSLNIAGRAVLAESVATSPTYALDPEWLVRSWRTITGIHNYEPRHLTQAVEFLADSQINWDTVVSALIALDEVPVEVQAAPSSNAFLRAAVRLS